ncbi:MAG: WG repeat-containing protein [Bacteroidales bacterium]|nr:WG repeat-containing protein [Bacteroidales bacterium]
MRKITHFILITILTIAFGGYRIKSYAQNQQISKLSDFSEKVALVQAYGKWGYINLTGKIAIKPQFNNARSFSQALAGVQIEKKWGFIDLGGFLKISDQYEAVGDFSNDLAPVKKNGKWGFIDKNNNLAIDFQFEDAQNFSDNRAAVMFGGKWGFIDKKGKYVCNPTYCEAGTFSNGLALVRTNANDNEWIYINKKGKIKIKTKFDNACSFKNGLASVQVDGKWGYILPNGKFCINPQFLAAKNFNDGFAAVKSAESWFFIDKKGKQTIGERYNLANGFSNGLALVSNQFEQFYINTKGIDTKIVNIPVVKENVVETNLSKDINSNQPRKLYFYNNLNIYNFSTVDIRIADVTSNKPEYVKCMGKIIGLVIKAGEAYIIPSNLPEPYQRNAINIAISFDIIGYNNYKFQFLVHCVDVEYGAMAQTALLKNTLGFGDPLWSPQPKYSPKGCYQFPNTTPCKVILSQPDRFDPKSPLALILF